MPIEELIDRFIEYNRTNNRESTTKRYIAVTNHLKEYLSAKHPNVHQISQLTEELIEGYKAFRKNSWVNPNGQKIKSKNDLKENTRKGARARTINLEVDGIKSMLNLAVRWGYLRRNPLKSLKPLKEDDRKPVRFLSEEECRKFLDSTPVVLYPVYFTLLHTGMRKSEIENLQWQDIDFKRRKIFIRRKPDWNPKSGEREIPISKDLFRVLDKLRKKRKKINAEDYVFNIYKIGHSHNWLRRELIKIAKAAKIENLTKIHTLRHTFASQLVMKGVDLPTVKKLMGHTDIQTTMVYAHLAPDHLSEAVDKLSF
jgi:integrase